MDYVREVEHSELLIVRGKEPFNAEPKASALVEFSLTPDDLVYCRNHGPVEDLDRATYVLTVAGTPHGDVKFTLHNLTTLFATHEVVAALQVSSSVNYPQKAALSPLIVRRQSTQGNE